MRAFSLALVVAALLASVPGHATTVAPLAPAALAAKSDLVARVVVRGEHTAWLGRRIITFYDVDVVETWRTRDQTPPRTAVVAVPGGRVGEIAQKVAGAPMLATGGTYVLFLSDDTGPGSARGVVGFWLGAYSVDGSGALRGIDHDGALLDPLTPAALRVQLGEAP